MPKVIVVPETDEYKLHVSHGNEVWITRRLGIPQLKEHAARYLAPYWLKEPQGVTRIYHILGDTQDGDSTNITLGNSFVLKSPWIGLGQRRRFEYHDLQDFGFIEAWPGMLVHISNEKQ